MPGLGVDCSSALADWPGAAGLIQVPVTDIRIDTFATGPAVAAERIDIDLAAVAESWRHGSVIRSWLLDLTADVLAGNQDLDDVAPFVADSGEGRWTALESIEQGIPTPVMSLALMTRFASQGKQDYSDKLLAMMRKQFGGHAVRSADD